MKQERSFGIIPFIRTGPLLQVLIVKLLTGYWGFPKGKQEEGETPQQTAVRELREETNLHVVSYCPLPPLTESYSFSREGSRVSKTVTYFLAYVEGELQCQEEELLEARWVELSALHDYILFKGTQSLIQTLLKLEKEQQL